MKTGQRKGNSFLFDLSTTFAENAVIPIPKWKKKFPYRTGQICISVPLKEKDRYTDRLINRVRERVCV